MGGRVGCRESSFLTLVAIKLKPLLTRYPANPIRHILYHRPALLSSLQEESPDLVHPDIRRRLLHHLSCYVHPYLLHGPRYPAGVFQSGHAHLLVSNLPSSPQHLCPSHPNY